MPRENSLSDSPARSLTPELPPETDPVPAPGPQAVAPIADGLPSPRRTMFVGSPGDRLRATVRKVIQLHRTSTVILRHEGVGAEPGIDPRKQSAALTYGHIRYVLICRVESYMRAYLNCACRQKCEIEVVDYSAAGRMVTSVSNSEFVDMMSPNAAQREPWVKVRWINIGGISWDVLSALAVKYREFSASSHDHASYQLGLTPNRYPSTGTGRRPRQPRSRAL